MRNDDLPSIIAGLTYNMGATLRYTVESPNKHSHDSLGGSGRVFTGVGKYTHIAARGVFKGLEKRGLAEARPLDPGRPDIGSSWHVTSLGREVGERLLANWDELAPDLIDKEWR